MNRTRFAGYRIIEFSESSKQTLSEIGVILLPSYDEILDKWVARQWAAWQPPGFDTNSLRSIFGGVLSSILGGIATGEINRCMLELEIAGGKLAKAQFPFEALIFSVHFLEQSYMPVLLSSSRGKEQKWLTAMDEFLHAVIAAIATSYFNTHKKELSDRAEVGRIVQEGLLANIPRSTEDVEVAHIYLSARERAQLGGDFLDFFTIEGVGAAFIIGDLSGHGLEAASDSLMLRSLFRGFMREDPSIINAMERVNNVLDDEFDIGQFATALAVTYKLSGELDIVNAGHPFPIICKSGEEKVCHIEDSDPALAIAKGSKYSSTSVNLEPGDVFVAFTDGILEARNLEEVFGEERAMLSVERMRGESARAIAEHLVDDALRFSGGRFTDDVAVLVLKRSTEHST